jgi:hypothetical protein
VAGAAAATTMPLWTAPSRPAPGTAAGQATPAGHGGR